MGRNFVHMRYGMGNLFNNEQLIFTHRILNARKGISTMIILIEIVKVEFEIRAVSPWRG
jgi:hypothetical protein